MRPALLVLLSLTACLAGDAHHVGSASTDGAASTDAAGDPSTSASGSADASSGSGGVAGYHPEGFAAADVHGTALKLHAEDCRVCHGADLKAATWR